MGLTAVLIVTRYRAGSSESWIPAKVKDANRQDWYIFCWIPLQLFGTSTSPRFWWDFGLWQHPIPMKAKYQTLHKFKFNWYVIPKWEMQLPLSFWVWFHKVIEGISWCCHISKSVSILNVNRVKWNGQSISSESQQLFIEQEIVEYNESALPSVCVYMDSAMFVEHSSGTMSMSFLLVHSSVCVQLSKLIWRALGQYY